VVIFAIDGELEVQAAPVAGRRNLIAVEGGEDLVKRFGPVWVKASPEGTVGMCQLFIHLGQFCLGATFLLLLTMVAICVSGRKMLMGCKRAQTFGAEFERARR